MVRAASASAPREGIAEQTTHYKFKQIILGLKVRRRIRQTVLRGTGPPPETVQPALRQHGPRSEMSGSFGKMLDRIAAYTSQQIETRKMVIGAMIYPASSPPWPSASRCSCSPSSSQIHRVFEGKEDALPWATTFLMGLSEFVRSQYLIILGSLLAVFIGFFALLKTDPGSWWFDKCSPSPSSSMFRASTSAARCRPWAN